MSTANVILEGQRWALVPRRAQTLAAPPTGNTQPGGTTVDIVAGELYSVTVAAPSGSAPSGVEQQVLNAFSGGATEWNGAFVDASTNGDGSLIVGQVKTTGAGQFSFPQAFQLVDQGPAPTGPAAVLATVTNWWGNLSTLGKVGVAAAGLALVGGGAYLLLHKKGSASRGKRRGKARPMRRRRLARRRRR